MLYETLSCGQYDCPLNKNGSCKLDVYQETPCNELNDEEFEAFKLEMEE